ncbi:hypothetical protein ABZ729_27885 [Streptomyces sp. NPDC006678]|uniref:hypothetical protein n=1 Tax=Streptomyces sp. NPDC006678 TaxID=3157185 RepID=UPI0033D7176A
MEAALVGLAGTTVGAATGFAGACGTGPLVGRQEGPVQGLLITLYGWHDPVASILRSEDDGKLSEHRSAAYKWIVEASLM